MRRRLTRSAVALAVVALLAGCSIASSSAASDPQDGAGSSSSASSAPPPATTTAVPAPTTVPSVLRVSVVGDSLTAGTGVDDSAQAPGSPSWLPSAGGSPLEIVGGWAYPGSTTAQMLAGALPADADVLVLLGGTNDLLQGVDPALALADIEAIVATVGTPDVLLVAIPPSATTAAAALAYNSALVALAASRGWGFFDPWTGVRLPDGSWTPGTTPDGVHPTTEVAALVGTQLRAALLTRAGY